MFSQLICNDAVLSNSFLLEMIDATDHLYLNIFLIIVAYCQHTRDQPMTSKQTFQL